MQEPNMYMAIRHGSQRGANRYYSLDNVPLEFREHVMRAIELARQNNGNLSEYRAGQDVFFAWDSALGHDPYYQILGLTSAGSNRQPRSQW